MTRAGTGGGELGLGSSQAEVTVAARVQGTYVCMQSTGGGERQGARGVLAGPGIYKLIVAASLRTIAGKGKNTTPSSQSSNLFTHNLSQQMSSLGRRIHLQKAGDENQWRDTYTKREGGRKAGKCLQKDQEASMGNRREISGKAWYYII